MNHLQRPFLRGQIKFKGGVKYLNDGLNEVHCLGTRGGGRRCVCLNTSKTFSRGWIKSGNMGWYLLWCDGRRRGGWWYPIPPVVLPPAVTSNTINASFTGSPSQKIQLYHHPPPTNSPTPLSTFFLGCRL